MKKIILLVVMMVPYAALGVEPSKVCPPGFVVVQEDAMTITTYASPSCPSGYTSVGSVSTCLLSAPVPSSCIMFAGRGPWTDSYGSYIFVQPCLLR